MSILINKDSKIIVQGITGGTGKFHTAQMLDYGTNIVAGTTPGKAGQEVLGVPVFNSVRDAVGETGGNVSIIFVPAPFAADAIMEAADAGVELIVCITEHIPVKDMITAKEYVDKRGIRLIGPNCPGLITPGQSKVGILPGPIHQPGRVGVISKSGTLTYESVNQLTTNGIGQSSAVGIGGDPIIGTTFIDALKLFNEDEETLAVLMIGEIGGNAEEEAAVWISENMTKPVVSFIAGQTAPPGKRMGHAGAIVSGGKGTAAEKIDVLRENGVTVADNLALIGETMIDVLKKNNLYEACLTVTVENR